MEVEYEQEGTEETERLIERALSLNLCCLRFLLLKLFLQILDRRPANGAVEGEGGQVEIIQRNRRIEIRADVEGGVRGEVE